LERFRTQYTSNALALLQHEDFKIALNHFCDCLLSGFDSPNTPNGCIAAMGPLEVGGQNDFLSNLIANGINEMLASIESRCVQAQNEQQLDSSLDSASWGSPF